MSTVNIILRKSKSKKGDECSLYVKIYKDGKASMISLKKTVNKSLWDKNRQRVTSKHPNSVRMNAYLANRIAEVESKLLKDEDEKNFSSTQQIKELVQGKRDLSFMDYANSFRDKYLREENYARYKKTKGMLDKLSRYAKKKDLAFGDITTKFLDDYTHWLKTVCGNKTNTIHTDLKWFKQLFNSAVREKLINSEKNPFAEYTLKKEKVLREFLSEEEIARIEALKLDESSRINDARNVFVVGCYTGLRIGDLFTLKKSAYDGTHIRFKMRKTGEVFVIKVPTAGRKILDQYCLDLNESQYIFPFIKDCYTSKMDVDKKIMSQTAYINKLLKDVAVKAEVKKKVTTHIARHSYASRALTMGIGVAYVQRLLGHADLKTTQVYAKLVNKELDKAVDLFG